MRRRWTVMILVLTMVLGLCACARREEAPAGDWREQYDLGLRYLSEGNYEEAILTFTAAIEIDPKQPDVYLALMDAYIGTGDYEKAAETLAQARAADFAEALLAFFEESAQRYESILAFLTGGGNGIRITNFRFDRESYLAGAPTQFWVSVAYRCPEEETCILMIGANTSAPDNFLMLDEDYTVTGSGGYQFSVTVMPVQWEGQDFGIYVNLSEADHAEKWNPFGFDVLYIDREGNVKNGGTSGPDEGDDRGDGREALGRTWL